MRTHLLALCTLALCSLGLASCNILGPALYFVQGPPKVPKQHTLEKDRATVIFVDDRVSALPRRTLRGVIADSAEVELLRTETLTNMIDGSSIQAAAARDTSEQGTSIVRLGQSVQADVVIYVWIERFGLTPDGATFEPFASARVKVIDVTAKESRTWPESFEGHPVSIMPRARSSDIPQTAAAQSKALDELATQLGSAIARLFYDSVPGQSVSDLRVE